MKFKTFYDQKPAEPTGNGSRFCNQYGVVANEAGERVPAVVGKIDIQAKLDAQNVGLSPSEILRRQAAAGDLSSLALSGDRFLDAASYPQDRAGWEQRKIDIENVFDNLSAAERRQFDFNLLKFIDFVDAHKVEIAGGKLVFGQPAAPAAAPVVTKEGEVIENA